VAAGVSANPGGLLRDEGLYRFVHPNNAKADGTLNSGVFSLRRDPAVSVGMEREIPPDRLAEFCGLKPEQGLARVAVGDVFDLELSVIPDREPAWTEFANAHAELTGYSLWPNKRKEDVAKRLRDLANKQIIKPVP